MMIPVELYQESSADEIEQTNRFKTYLNYLVSISDYLGDISNNLSSFLAEIIHSRQFNSIQGGRCRDEERMSKLLRNSWFTEIQMNMSASYDDYIPYTNHWLPVQTYYSIYLALRAFFYASGSDVIGDHTTSLRSIAEEIQRRPALFPSPWAVYCSGDPDNETISFHNLPIGVSISEISTLTSSHRVLFWDSYAKFLKTTRKRQIEKQCFDWKVHHRRKRIDTAVKQHFVDNLSPTTLFNCLYRMRLRSNYADADSFLLAVQNSSQAKDFHSALLKINWTSLALLELLIARHVGKRAYTTIVDSFRRYDRAEMSNDLVLSRWDQMKTLW